MDMLTAYVALGVWFYGVDLLAGRLAGSKRRPVAAAVLAAAWPLSVALALLAAAALFGCLRERETRNG